MREHLVLEVPLPPPGKLRVEFGLHAGGARFGYCRPPLNRLPLADLSPPRSPQHHFFFQIGTRAPASHSERPGSLFLRGAPRFP